jgi:hypothetical protein
VARTRSVRSLAALALAATLAAPGASLAVTVDDLAGLEEHFGRWAPGGDCKREPRIHVERAGMTFEVGGAREKVSRMEWAVSYGGNSYEGISDWIFPFGSEGNHSILMTFNDGEKKGVLAITPHDEGWQGGPPLGARNAALVAGSPYARCP